MIVVKVRPIARSSSAQDAQVPSYRLVGGSVSRLRKTGGCDRQSKACAPTCYARLRSLETAVSPGERPEYNCKAGSNSDFRSVDKILLDQHLSFLLLLSFLEIESTHNRLLTTTQVGNDNRYRYSAYLN